MLVCIVLNLTESAGCNNLPLSKKQFYMIEVAARPCTEAHDTKTKQCAKCVAVDSHTNLSNKA